MAQPESTTFSLGSGPQASFGLDPVDLYEYPGQDTVTPLKTCALNSEVKRVSSSASSSDNFVFDTQIGSTQFLGNDVKLGFTFPLVVKLAADAASKITAANFMETAFNYNADIVYSQYSVLQAIQHIAIKLNDADLPTINNVAESFNAIAPYYATGDVDEWFHASQPDRFQSFNKYTASSDTAGKTVTYYNENASKVTTSLSIENDSNIFNSTTQNKYISRTPEWEWVDNLAGDTTGKKGCRVKCTMYCYIPLSLFGTPENPTSFPGVNRFTVSVQMKNLYAQYLFNTKPKWDDTTKTWVPFYNDITTDPALSSSMMSWMLLRIYTAPQFMRESMIEKATGLMKAYSLTYPRIQTHLLDSYPNTAAGSEVSFGRDGLLVNSVPSAIYVSIMKKKEGAFSKLSSTPINFGLIKNLTVKIDSTITTFNDIMSLGYLSDSNGYAELDPIGRLIKGYPIKIDLSKDVGLPGDTVIGALGNFNISVEGKFINQGDAASSYQLCVVIVNSAALTFDGTSFTTTTGARINSAVLKESNFLSSAYSNYTRDARVVGGGFFGNAARFVKKAAVNAWNNRENIARALGEANKIRGMIMGGKLPASNVSGAGRTPTLGAGDVTRNIFR